ncbi:MAG TPA: Hsp20/alpha crystallin family protein [Candidatus Babeliales bacterium]|nr:Hsp20/alpha crystallin family protein [Candidatus Babeliales bacterium]
MQINKKGLYTLLVMGIVGGLTTVELLAISRKSRVKDTQDQQRSSDMFDEEDVMSRWNDDMWNFDFPTLRTSTTDLATDMYEKDGNVIIKMHIPGVKLEDVKISVQDDTVRIHGTRKEEIEEKSADFYRKEIKQGSFERRLPLPAKAVPGKAKATMKDGVLQVVIPVESEEATNAVQVPIEKGE